MKQAFPIQDFNAGIHLIVDDVKMLVEAEKQAIREAVEKRCAALDEMVATVTRAARATAGMPSLLAHCDDDIAGVSAALQRLAIVARNDDKTEAA